MQEPNIKETAFSCPNCGAYTTQYWHDCYVKYKSKDSLPFIPEPDFEEEVLNNKEIPEDIKQKWIEWARKMRGKVLFTEEKDDSQYSRIPVLHNLFLTQCYNCKKWAIWVNEDLIYPLKKFGSLPNQDLPTDILGVVEEARSILDTSPKGSAALLRLSMQLLVKHLGESGENLNNDIANLVKKGMNPIVQKSLDIVRVIGNESVHPGVIDLNDDKDSAYRLFDLINIIAEQMITQPKHVQDLYEKLPESKRTGIEKRNSKALANKNTN